MKLRWQFGILAGIVLMICGLYPQLKLWYVRGSEWQGSYAYNDIDEVAYASYLRALIDGRPRKNDPYTGRDDSPEKPQEESLFSIQFAAPYTIAVPSRIFGLSASTAMWLTGGIAAFLTALAVFWLVGKITEDSLFAMTATLMVLCGGALAAGEGAIGEVLGSGFSYPYFPFLRRYIPAVGFPFFFALCGFVWLLVNTSDYKKRIFYCVLASFCFAYLVFTYFYLWTTAAAWLVGLVLLWLLIRPEDWLKDFKGFLALGLACLIPLIFYAYLLSMRSHTMDEVQLLVFTRELDLWRVPSVISYSTLFMIAVAVFLKTFNLKDRSTIFAVSFALVPLIVFNQQLITGRSLQPIHYQVFIGNYVAALALMITFGLLFKNLKSRFLTPLFIVFSIIASVWGIVECHYTVRVLDEANLLRDRGMAVARRLEELSKTEKTRGVIYPLSMVQGDDSPTVSPQSVLWARHQHVFAGVTWQENKERYYQLLYYMGLNADDLAREIKGGDFVSMIALFGWGRHTDRLNSAYKPLTYFEVDEEARKFGQYIDNFDFEKASNPTISYLIVPKDWKVDLSNFDLWYERQEPELLDEYLLYKVKLRNQP